MKKLYIIFAVILFMLCAPLTAYAENSSRSESYDDITKKISDALEESTDSSTEKILEDNDISVGTTKGISSLSLKDVMKSIADTFIEKLKLPLQLLGKMIAVAVLCSIAAGLAPENDEMTGLFNSLSVLFSVIAIYDGIYAGLETIKNSLDKISRFMLAYIPIFSSVAAASGNAASGGSYYASTLAVCEIIAVVSNKILMPFLSIVLAISLVSAVNPELSFCSAADSIKKCVQWILGGLMTIFSGLLTIQSITGATADSLAAKGIKFAASSFIPIVGGAVSEAYSTVYGSMGMIRSTTGAVGIIIISVMVLQPIITLLAIKLVIGAGTIINQMFGQKQTSAFLASINSVLTIGVSILVVFSMIFIIATAVLMMSALHTV